MGLELAAQFGWELPDVIFYPTGGGTGLIGMWKAFAELEALGLIGAKRPRMVAVQAEGCAPIVRAWQAGADHAAPWENAADRRRRHPRAEGDRRFPDPRARCARAAASPLAVSETEIFAARDEAARTGRLLLCPEGAATLAAWRQRCADGPDRPERPRSAVQLRLGPQISAARTLRGDHKVDAHRARARRAPGRPQVCRFG